jgi:hypothetical protein
MLPLIGAVIGMAALTALALWLTAAWGHSLRKLVTISGVLFLIVTIADNAARDAEPIV